MDIYLEDYAEELAKRTGKTAVALSATRISRQFTNFFEKASNTEEKLARKQLVDDEIRRIVAEACTEAGYPESPEKIYAEVMSAMKLSEERPPCPHCGSHDWDSRGMQQGKQACHCQDCGKRFFADPETKEISKEAAEPQNAGDSNQIKHEDVSKDTKPKLDKTRVPEKGLDPIDIGSKDHPHEDQDVEQKRVNENTTGNPEEGVIEHPRKRVDADDTIGDTDRSGQGGSFGKGNQTATPVTSRWHVIG